MKYKIVKNADGEVIAYGPNDDQYEPFLADGQTLHIVDEVPEPSKRQKDAEKAEKQARRAVKDSALSKLQAIGLTRNDLKMLLDDDDD